MSKKNKRLWWIIKYLFKGQGVKCPYGTKCKAESESHFIRRKHL